MKKSLVVVALLVMGIAVLWAEGVTEKGTRNLSIGGAYGFMYESLNVDGSTEDFKSESLISSFAPNITLVQTFSTSKWNYLFDVAFEFPAAMSVKLSTDLHKADWEEVDLDQDGTFIIGIGDMRWGGLYSLIETNKLHVVAGPFASIQFFYLGTNVGFYLGTGASIQSLCYLNDRLFFRAGASLTVNPFMSNFSDSSFLFNIGFDPSIGIGIRY